MGFNKSIKHTKTKKNFDEKKGRWTEFYMVKLSLIYCLVSCLLSAKYCQMSNVRYVMSAVYTVSRPLSAVYCQLSIFSCSL